MLLVRAYKEETENLQHLYCSCLLEFNTVVLQSFLESLLAILTGGEEWFIKYLHQSLHGHYLSGCSFINSDCFCVK